MDPERAPDERAESKWLRYTHVGLQYCLTLLLFVLGGWWADRRLDTDPWLTITGSLLGFLAATYGIVRETGRIRS